MKVIVSLEDMCGTLTPPQAESGKRVWSLFVPEVYDASMSSFFHLKNVIRDYTWGHEKLIYDFLNLENPGNRPAAEVWMGAHPLAPSEIEVSGIGRVGLDLWIEKNPITMLGPDISSRYASLPFLFKLLAAGDSLSIQAHPSKQKAVEGFRREEAEGITRDAVNRNYRDDNHKPEIIMALTLFSAMIGFRNPRNIVSNFSVPGLKGTSAADLISVKKEDAVNVDGNKNGKEIFLKSFLNKLLTLDGKSRKQLLESSVVTARGAGSGWTENQCYWINRLTGRFPGDIGALAPLFLNIVELEAGEALYQGAGELHAYLEGFGIELMANSDNVLRGGLTPKFIDVPELLRVLDFRSSNPKILHAVDAGSGIRRFDSPASEFSLGLADLEPETPFTLQSGSGPMIILVLQGSVKMSDGTETLDLVRGGSAFVPWNAREIILTGDGRIALAGVGE